MSVRTFNRSRRIRSIAGILCVLGFAAFLVRMVAKVQAGYGLEQYTSRAGYPAYPLGVVILAAIVLPVGGVAFLLNWWRRSAGRSVRRRGRSDDGRTQRG
jgi:hypothetical protein